MMNHQSTGPFARSEARRTLITKQPEEIRSPKPEMEPQLNDKRSGRSAARALLLGTSAGIAIGVAIALVTGNAAVATGMAAGIGILITNILRKGKR